MPPGLILIIVLSYAFFVGWSLIYLPENPHHAD